ncbi:MAG: hypothetical protein GXP27_01645, partial [Planctomycetes bacterium]|nr:hypothetical protein [Planctomycetota bacterium]
ELASVANQFGRRRTLCETYGAGGWDLRFEDMKRIGDWVSVLGVNTIDEHLSYVTIRGARKRDHPQSFSYHEPWWEAYHVVARYLTRLSLVLSSGQQVNRILLFEPTTTTWMYQSDARMEQIGQRFQRLVTVLAQRQVEFDIGSEYLMEQHGRVEGRALVIGQRRYDIVVLPEDVENLNSKTLELLNRYLAAGGLVLSCSPPPTRIDGRESDRGRALAEAEGFRRIKPDALPGELLRRSRDGFALVQDEGDQGILYHQRRQLDDGQFVFLVNTSLEAPCRGTLEAEAAGMERWNLHTGQVEAYPFRRTKGGVRARFELPPCGSLLLFLSRKPVEPAQVARHRDSRLKPAGPMQIERIAPNVLTLDYVDLSVRGKKMKGHYFFIAATLVFQNHGLHGNPWERSVQFRDELIRKRFPPDSGFSATYRFTIRSRVPQPLFIVIEQPELYSITCNGKPVKAEPGQWWLDKSFGVIDISEAARVGENAVTITARPLTIYHELEPAYVLGDFALKPTQAGFEIVPPQPIRFEKRLAHGNDPEGSMWLSAGIGYHRDPNAAKGNDRDPFVVFDLGRTCNLRGIRVWNYSEVNYTHRGVDELKILGSKTGQPDSFTIPIGTFRLAEATGDGLDFGQWLDVRADGVRYVQFDILSNHRGDRYPIKKAQQSHAFVGLSEVRFYAAKADQVEPAEIEGVRVHAFSSELKDGHNRLARFLVDGTGLSLRPVGWNRQGYPFYAAGVAYQQIFNVEQPAGRYVVRWKNWLGSVAKVVVNGELAGYVGWQPWQCDVTEHIRAGQNEVKVIVIGTLRNTLGPHHAGPVRGAAWPPAFQRGPRTGPPPGDAYHTLDYGLFEPFELVRQQ